MIGRISSHAFFVGCISILLVVFGCQRDEDFMPTTEEEPVAQAKTYPGVNAELWPYFERFETEATLRGFSIDLREANITGDIDALSEDGVAGVCSYHFRLPNEVTIDRDFWRNARDLSKEFVVFHELGHCNLGRNHRESSYTNGACRSIMRSGTGDCLDNYTSRTRAAYLNELFDERFRNEIGGG